MAQGPSPHLLLLCLAVCSLLLGTCHSVAPSETMLSPFGCDEIRRISTGLYCRLRPHRRLSFFLEGRPCSHIGAQMWGSDDETKIAVENGTPTIGIAQGVAGLTASCNGARLDLVFDEGQVKESPTQQAKGRTAQDLGRQAWALEAHAANRDEIEKGFSTAAKYLCAAGLVRECNRATRYHALYFFERTLDYPGARRIIEAAWTSFELDPRERASAHYSLGSFAEISHDLRAAIHELQQGAVMSKQLRIPELLLGCTVEQMVLAARLANGEQVKQYADEALQILRDPTAELLSCQRASAYNSLAWAALMFERAKIVGPQDSSQNSMVPMLPFAETWLRSALSAYGKECRDGSLYKHILVGLARLHVQNALRVPPHGVVFRKELTEAEGFLSRASELPPSDATLQLDLNDLRGQIALLQADFALATIAYEKLQADALGMRSIEALWAAQAGLGRTAAARGDRMKALQAFARAEQVTDLLVLSVPLFAGRQRFVLPHEQATRDYLELLLRAPADPDEALRVLGQARRRATSGWRLRELLDHLDGSAQTSWTQRLAALHRARIEHWERLASEPGAPADVLDAALDAQATTEQALRTAYDETSAVLQHVLEAARVHNEPKRPRGNPYLATFTCQPLLADWACFLALPGQTRVARMNRLDGASLAQIWNQWHNILDSTTGIRIISYGPMREFDFRLLSYQDRTLGDYFTIEYSFDMNPPPSPISERTMVTALILDPTGDLLLPTALAPIRQKLSQQGWQTELLSYHTNSSIWNHNAQSIPSSDRVYKLMHDSDLFLFEGHAITRGVGGWDSHLVLAEQTHLSPIDILAMPKVPRWVVLLGCSTANSDTAAPVDDIGLAQAFLSRGSEAVIATVRPVSNTTATAVREALLNQPLLQAAHVDLVTALHSALRSLALQHPEQDWSAFRAYTP